MAHSDGAQREREWSGDSTDEANHAMAQRCTEIDAHGSCARRELGTVQRAAPCVLACVWLTLFTHCAPTHPPEPVPHAGNADRSAPSGRPRPLGDATKQPPHSKTTTMSLREPRKGPVAHGTIRTARAEQGADGRLRAVPDLRRRGRGLEQLLRGTRLGAFAVMAATGGHAGSKSAAYDDPSEALQEQWVDKQERAFTAWINAQVDAAARLPGVPGVYSDRVLTAARGAAEAIRTKLEPVRSGSWAAPPPLAACRTSCNGADDASGLGRSTREGGGGRGPQEIAAKRIVIRDDSDLASDMGQRDHVIQLVGLRTSHLLHAAAVADHAARSGSRVRSHLGPRQVMAYNTIWLVLGLKAVFEPAVAVPVAHDRTTLVTFLQ